MLCALLGAASLVSCRGKVLDLGNDDPSPTTDLAGECIPPSQIKRTFATHEDLASALRGRWFRCRGVERGILFFPGIEFTDTDWFGLVDDGTGKYVRSADPAQRGIWYAEAPLTLHVRFENRSTQTLVLLFSTELSHFSVERSTFDTVDVGYVRQ